MKDSIDQLNADVAIIGGGVSGVLAAVQLVRHRLLQEPAPLKVVIVNESEHLARGPAYSTKCAEHLLNVPAKGMSGLVEEPEHFINWLRRRGLPSSREAFARRDAYGEYIEELFHETKAAAPEHIDVQVLRGQVVSCRESGSGVDLTLQSGKKIAASVAVLALGNYAPEQSVFNSYLKDQNDTYHANPWAYGLSKVPADDDVVIIGTGLTMVDVALELRANGHRAQMVAVSRHGYLPHGHFTDERLADDSGTGYLPKEIPATTLGAFKVIRKAMEEANSRRDGDWRFVISELRPITSRLWSKLDLTERKRFMRHCRQLWDIHRHRMAPEIAAAVSSLIAAGTLSIVAGRVVGIESFAGGYTVVVQKRHGERVALKGAHIINCTGPQTDLRRVREPLLQSLIADGTIVSDELGLSPETAANAALISKCGIASERLFAIGPLRRAELWESIAVPELRVQARDLALEILSRLEKKNSGLPALVPASV